MRFIHMADMHFDTPFTLLSNHEELGDLRRLEQRKVFKKIIDKIKEENIPYLFISGDLYEEQYVRRSTIEFINNLFKTIPNTKIFISPGNHDPLLKNSYYNEFNWEENVYIFNAEVQKFEFEDADIYGYGFNDFYCTDSKIEEINIENKNKLNILVVHGSLNASNTLDLQYNPLNENKLKEIGFDYVALGHIHKRTINKNISYPGSTISLGFDELGEHGALDVNLEKEKLDINFIKLDEKEFLELNINISEINSEEELVEKIINLKLDENKYYKIILEGNKNFEINRNKILKLININNILKIKDNSKININIEELKKQNNLTGYFIREMMKIKDKKIYDEETVENAIEIGLNALKKM